MAEIVGKPKSFNDTAREIARRFFRHENAALVVVLVALIGGMGVITKGKTTALVNMMNVLVQSSTRGVAALGQAFVILTAGIDVSVGGVGLVCAVIGTSLMTSDMSMNLVGHAIPLYPGILVMLLVGAGWGAINGSLVSRIGIPALIVTLGMWEMSTGAGFEICRGYTIFELPDGLAFFGQGSVLRVPVPVIIFIAVAVVAYFVLNHTTYGRSVYAVGGNPVSAWLSGIKVKNMLFSVYTISGFLAGLAAVIMTGRVTAASMKSMEGLEIDSIAAATIGGVSLMGGRGTVIGVVLGALIIGVVNNAMSILGASPGMVGMVKGAIIITAVGVDYVRKRG